MVPATLSLLRSISQYRKDVSIIHTFDVSVCLVLNMRDALPKHTYCFTHASYFLMGGGGRWWEVMGGDGRWWEVMGIGSLRSTEENSSLPILSSTYGTDSDYLTNLLEMFGHILQGGKWKDFWDFSSPMDIHYFEQHMCHIEKHVKSQLHMSIPWYVLADFFWAYQ